MKIKKEYRGYTIQPSKINGVTINIVNGTGFTFQTIRRNILDWVNEHFAGDTQAFVKHHGSPNIMVNWVGYSFRLSTFR